MKKIILLFKLAWLCLLTYIIAVGNTAVLDELKGFFSQRDSTSDSICIYLSMSMMILAIINAIPLALAMCDAKDPDKQNTLITSNASKSVLSSQPQKKACLMLKKFGKLVLIGGPPALLDSAGTLLLNNPNKNISFNRYLWACFSGFVAAIGYKNLLAHDIEVAEGCMELFRKINSRKKKAKALFNASSIVLGTLAETFLSADIFFATLGMSEIFKKIATSVVTLLTSGFICNSEIRSVFCEILNNESSNQNSCAKYFILIPALLAGVFGTLGVAKIVEYIHADLSLKERIIVFFGAVMLFVMAQC